MMSLSQLPRCVVLRDGRSTLIRAIRPDDKQRLLDGFHRLRGKSVYFRFFSAKKDLTEKELKFYTEVDFEHHVAVVSTIESNDEEKIIGVGRYIELTDNDTERSAEMALAVDDDHQNLGVGTILFEYLVTIAHNKGIARLEADVLLDNRNMQEIFEHSGFELKKTTRSGVTHIQFNIKDAVFNKYYLD